MMFFMFMGSVLAQLIVFNGFVFLGYMVLLAGFVSMFQLFCRFATMLGLGGMMLSQVMCFSFACSLVVSGVAFGAMVFYRCLR